MESPQSYFSKQRLSIYGLLFISDVVSSGVVLLLINNKIGPLPTSATIAVQVGTVLYCIFTLTLVISNSTPPLSNPILGVFYSYAIFSILTGLVILTTYY